MYVFLLDRKLWLSLSCQAQGRAEGARVGALLLMQQSVIADVAAVPQGGDATEITAWRRQRKNTTGALGGMTSNYSCLPLHGVCALHHHFVHPDSPPVHVLLYMMSADTGSAFELTCQRVRHLLTSRWSGRLPYNHQTASISHA